MCVAAIPEKARYSEVGTWAARREAATSVSKVAMTVREIFIEPCECQTGPATWTTPSNDLGLSCASNMAAPRSEVQAELCDPPAYRSVSAKPLLGGEHRAPLGVRAQSTSDST